MWKKVCKKREAAGGRAHRSRMLDRVSGTFPACKQASAAAVPASGENMHVVRNRSSLPSLIGHLDTINFPKAPARFPERAGAEFLAAARCEAWRCIASPLTPQSSASSCLLFGSNAVGRGQRLSLRLQRDDPGVRR